MLDTTSQLVAEPPAGAAEISLNFCDSFITSSAERSRLPGSEQLTADERDRLVERGAARTGVTHRGVLVTDRHAAEEDEPVGG
jgi:hypothetical protein